MLKDEELAIIEEPSKEEVEGLRRKFEVHSMTVNFTSVEEVLAWVRSARMFKKRSFKNNKLMALVN